MRTLLTLVLFAGLTVMSAATAKSIKLTTVDWPPYVFSDGSGPNTETVREIFSQAGVDVVIQVLPWNRAVKLAADDPEWIGVYPEYYSDDIDAEKRGRRCLFSMSFGFSPVGFLKRKDSNFTWSRHEDLSRYVVGVVRGHINEDLLDQMIAIGEIAVDLAENDAENILKVAARRSDAIVIDQHVFQYLIENNDAIAGVAGELEFHDQLLIEQGLHVCFENSATGRAARDLFDKHLMELN
jgi:polar amino acid transport system substrate-binding protein